MMNKHDEDDDSSHSCGATFSVAPFIITVRIGPTYLLAGSLAEHSARQ